MEAWTPRVSGSRGLRWPRSSLVGARLQDCTLCLSAPPSVTGQAVGRASQTWAPHFSGSPFCSLLLTLLCSSHSSHPGLPLCSSPVPSTDDSHRVPHLHSGLCPQAPSQGSPPLHPLPCVPFFTAPPSPGVTVCTDQLRGLAVPRLERPRHMSRAACPVHL